LDEEMYEIPGRKADWKEKLEFIDHEREKF
jgi:hypothetical protein